MSDSSRVCTWTGEPPRKCDLCKQPITAEFVDGRVRGGSAWANMCPGCHSRSGAGIGTGLGQRYVLNPKTSVFEKVAG